MIDDMEKTLSIARALGLYTVQVNNGKSTSSVHTADRKAERFTVRSGVIKQLCY